MRMKISGGIARGRKIGAAAAFRSKGDEDRLRPTTGKAREALFSILRNRLSGASFLDLYAGTGAVGLEALSRGAAEAVFVEINRLRAKLIEEYLERVGFTGRARVVRGTVADFILAEQKRRRQFDIVFLDPPYDTDEASVSLGLCEAVVGAGGIVVAEHFFKNLLPERSGLLRLIRDYRYGDTVLSMYQKEES